MKTYGGVDVYLHELLTSTQGVSDQLHGLATLPPGKIPWYPSDRRPARACLDVLTKRKKIPAHARNRDPVVKNIAQSLHGLNFLLNFGAFKLQVGCS
jgi:hypothetical protein